MKPETTPTLINCASCERPPETNGAQARCSTENCFIRSLMGWISITLWNSSMDDLAVARVQQSADDMRYE